MAEGINLEAEKDFISILLGDSEALVEHADRINPDLFFDGFNKRMVEKVRDCLVEDAPIEVSTLTNNPNEQEILETLKSRGKKAEHLEHYYRVLEECHIHRNLEDLASNIYERLENGREEPSSLLHETRQVLENFDEQRSSSIFKASDIIDGIVENHIKMYEMYQAGEAVVNPNTLTTHLKGLNDILLTGGFSGGDVVIIAASPSLGKTELALNLGAHAGMDLEKNVFVYSLEMSKESLTERMILERSEIDSYKLQRGMINEVDVQRLRSAGKMIHKSGIFFDDNMSGNVYDIISSARKIDAKDKLDMVIVDYLQMVESDGRANRNLELATISRLLKKEAVRMNIPFIILSQLSRNYLREGREPELRDLRDSGAIEQDADVVIMLYATSKEISKLNTKTKMIIRKQRNGPLGEVYLENHKPVQKFLEISASEYNKGNKSQTQKDAEDDSDDDLPF